MVYDILVTKLLMSKERFMSETELKDYCKKLGISYSRGIKYLGKYNYIKRILRGFFYVPSIEERKLKMKHPNVYEAIARAMEYKKVKNWYFGLETAIKWNGITHEVFTIDYVVSDIIFRPKPITVLGSRIKFVKLKKDLVKFGIKKSKDKTPFSDLEKTLLDIIYLEKYKGKSDKTIRDYIIEWYDHADKAKMLRYARHYTESVQTFVENLK